MENNATAWKKRIFDTFPPIADSAWHDQVLKDLKDADYAKKLLWTSYENIVVKPYYRLSDLDGLDYLSAARPGAFPFIRGLPSAGNSWLVRQEIITSDPATAGALAADAQRHGAQALGFRSRYDHSNGSLRGVALQNSGDMAKLLAGLDVTGVPLAFDHGPYGPLVLTWLAAYADKNKVDASRIRGGLDYDPIGECAVSGFAYGDEQTIMERIHQLIAFGRSRLPVFRPLTVHGDLFHEAGGSATEEIACLIAIAVEYLHRLTDAGLDIRQAVPMVGFRMAVGSNMFFEIAKFRATRLLWAHVADAFGFAEEPGAAMSIEAVSSTWNKTLYDPHTNLLRLTAEAMSAILGGCHSVALLPHDMLSQESGAFSYRMARNIQLILRHEALFDRVADPASGSYYIEKLTDDLASRAWDFFNRIEQAGGFVAAVREGIIQQQILDVRTQKCRNIEARREVFLGTNQFPLQGEKMVDPPSPPRVVCLAQSFTPLADMCPLSHLADAALVDVVKSWHKERQDTPALLTLERGSVPFEKIRLASEEGGRKRGHLPTVSLISDGALAMRIARATFIANFFGCAGYQVHNNPACLDAKSLQTLLRQQKPDIVVLCSSDDEYPTLMAKYAPLIACAVPGASKMIAGNPLVHKESLIALGADDFVHIGTHAISFFNNYHQKIGL